MSDSNCLHEEKVVVFRWFMKSASHVVGVCLRAMFDTLSVFDFIDVL